METSLSAALLQKRAVDVAQRLSTASNFPLRGAGSSAYDTGRELIGNGVVRISDSRDAIKQKLMNCRVPWVQAFYTLGIELPLEILGDWFIQGSLQL